MDKRRKKGKANERKEKVKRGKDEEVKGQGGKRGAPAPHGALIVYLLHKALHAGRRHMTFCCSKQLNRTLMMTAPRTLSCMLELLI